MRGAKRKERSGFISRRALQWGQVRCLQASILRKSGVRTSPPQAGHFAMNPMCRDCPTAVNGTIRKLNRAEANRPGRGMSIDKDGPRFHLQLQFPNKAAACLTSAQQPRKLRL